MLNRHQPSFARSAILFALLVLTPAGLAAQRLAGRYIVELSEPSIAEVTVQSAERAHRGDTRDRKAAVEAQQRMLRRMLASYGAETYGAVETVANALLVRISDNLAERIESIDGVRAVHKVYEVQLYLERALLLHHVPQAWARVGGPDAAGAGVKIAIIDSGIDPTHEGFIDPSLPMPEGFPLANRESDLAFTSNKVIVARSYDSLFSGSSDSSARPRNGHGTAVAMAAAGVVRDTPDGPISGVAPKAWLGSYKIIDTSGTTSSDLILKAIDDAVRDGMDVINLSLGSAIAERPQDQILVRVINRAAALGVAVVVAAGNGGPGRYTLGDTAVPAMAFSVGASWNDRTLGPTVHLETGQDYEALPGNGPPPSAPISAPVFDVGWIDPTGLACDPLPANSLTGQIAFILRGDCFFEDKLNYADAAGATAAVVYTHAQEPDAIYMDVGNATLPAVMVSHADGLEIKGVLAENGAVGGTISLAASRPVDPNRLATFSSRGPNTDLSIKPDLVATGVALNTAQLGGGFSTTQGTSFSAPIVTGAVATLMSGRPGYTIPQYRSLLVNTADPLILSDGIAPVQEAGSGLLDLDRAIETTVAVSPVSLSYGDTTGSLSRRFSITNLDTELETYTVTTQHFGDGRPPTPSEAAVTIPAGESRTINLELTPQGLPPGEYEGYVWIHGSRAGTDLHIPYWYAIPSGVPAYLNIVWSEDEDTAGELVWRAIGLRVTDAAGIPILEPAPTVTVESGGGRIVSVFQDGEDSPGLYVVHVRLGETPGDNVFEIEAGDLSKEVTIEGR